MSCCQLTLFDIMICHVIAFFFPHSFLGNSISEYIFQLFIKKKKKKVLTLIFYYQNYNLLCKCRKYGVIWNSLKAQI